MLAQEIAEQFERANQAAIDYVVGLSSDHWQLMTPDEGWPVGVTARHIALGHDLMLGWVAAVASRAPVDAGDLDAENARVAAAGVVATPGQVAHQLRTRGRELASALRGLSESALTADIDFGGRPTAAAMVARIPARHVETHLASIRAAVEGGARPSASADEGR